jgi:serine/threonine-protein kinase RsbW
VRNNLAIIDHRQRLHLRKWAAKRPRRRPHAGAFQRQPVELILDKVVSSDPTLLDDAVSEIMAAIDRTACWDDVETIGLAAREALANAMIHGNGCDPEKTVGISVTVNANCDVVIVVKDSGSGFDIRHLPDPIAAENLLADHGRGIFLMNQIMDEVDFRFDHGTEVCMRRRRQSLE